MEIESDYENEVAELQVCETPPIAVPVNYPKQENQPKQVNSQPNTITEPQKSLITKLRGQCVELGLLELACKTIQPRKEIASEYIKELIQAVNSKSPQQSQNNPAASSKQLNYIKSLRLQCYDYNLNDLARKQVKTMQEANNYIKEMKEALSRVS